MNVDPETVGLVKDASLAVMLILIAIGVFVPKGSHDDVKKSRDRAIAGQEAAYEVLTRNNDVIEKSNETNRRTAESVDKLLDMVERALLREDAPQRRGRT